MIDNDTDLSWFILEFANFRGGYPEWNPDMPQVNEYFRRLLPFDRDTVLSALRRASNASRNRDGRYLPPPAPLVQECAEALRRGQTVTRDTAERHRTFPIEQQRDVRVRSTEGKEFEKFVAGAGPTVAPQHVGQFMQLVFAMMGKIPTTDCKAKK